MIKKIIPILLIIICFTSQGFAWVYPEHRQITVIAILKLDSSRRALLDHLWKQARTGFESRLCDSVVNEIGRAHV